VEQAFDLSSQCTPCAACWDVAAGLAGSERDAALWQEKTLASNALSRHDATPLT
jgi:cytidine deaminase